jgi:citrate lyase synthetase
LFRNVGDSEDIIAQATFQKYFINKLTVRVVRASQRKLDSLFLLLEMADKFEIYEW